MSNEHNEDVLTTFGGKSSQRQRDTVCVCVRFKGPGARELTRLRGPAGGSVTSLQSRSSSQRDCDLFFSVRIQI